MTKFCISCVLGNFAVIQNYLWLHKNGKGLTVLCSLKPLPEVGSSDPPTSMICGFQTLKNLQVFVEPVQMWLRSNKPLPRYKGVKRCEFLAPNPGRQSKDQHFHIFKRKNRKTQKNMTHIPLADTVMLDRIDRICTNGICQCSRHPGVYVEVLLGLHW